MKKFFIIVIVLIILFISFCYKYQENNILIIGNTYDINKISNNYLNSNSKIVKIIDNKNNINDLMYIIKNNISYNKKPIKNYIIKANKIIISIKENSIINTNDYSKKLFDIYKQMIILIKEISKEKIILLIRLDDNNEYTKIFKNKIRNYCLSKEIVIIFS